jgi:hypothetical protein
MMLFKTLQTEPYPVYEIELSQLSQAADISAIMKKLDVVYYTYTFDYNGLVIKYGISVDKKSNSGDRIYRQAGHLSGWKYRLVGPNGNDMRIINDYYFQETGTHLNRVGMKIIVRDLTRVSSPSVDDPVLHVKQLERQLIKEHEKLHGHIPIGNIKDESYLDKKSYIAKSTWNALFE